MPSEEEIYDMFLATAGTCPKCGEYLYVEKEKYGFGNYYEVTQKCLSKTCDYQQKISNSFNKAMGLIEFDKKTKEASEVFVKKAVSKVKHYSSSSPLPIGYWDINDVIGTSIICPVCHIVGNYEMDYSVELKSIVYKCDECSTEFMLTDIDTEAKEGEVIILKNGLTVEV